ncbi:MAG TPA: hypothetical protein VFI31_12040 [Pirellulales bacterium]|nr:hypothetical protein [Pirellulales bacterium]
MKANTDTIATNINAKTAISCRPTHSQQPLYVTRMYELNGQIQLAVVGKLPARAVFWRCG